MRQDWVDEPFLAIDCETTGVNPFKARVVQVAAVEVFPDETIGETFSVVIDPGVEIPADAAAIHGITTDLARSEGARPADALERVADMIFAHGTRRALVGFNMRYDWPLLIVEAERHHIEWPCFASMLDPYLLDRVCDRYRKGKRKLTLVTDFYGVPLGDGAHGALADATAAGQVMRRLLTAFPQLGEHTLASLWLRQVRDHEADRLRFIDYMRVNVDPTFDSAAGWPIPSAPDPQALVPAPGGTDVLPGPPPGPAGDDEDQAHGAPGPVVPEPVGEEAPAASSPAPGDRGVTVRDVAMWAGRAFKAAGEAAPARQKTKTITRLRYALTFLHTDGRTVHANELTPRERAAVAGSCVSIERGEISYKADDDGVTFTKETGQRESRSVLWAQFEPNEAA